MWGHVRAIYGGEGFWRADQTDGHRHGARAVFCAALQYRADTTGAGDLPPAFVRLRRDRRWAGGEADALGADSVLGEG